MAADPALVQATAAATAAQIAAGNAALVSLIALVVQTTGALGLAWIAYKTAMLGRVMSELEKNTNSIKDALVSTTAAKSHAEGVLEEKTRQKDGAL